MAIAGKVAILPKGEWDSAVTYEKLDAVSYDNALYIAKKPSVGQVPTDGEYWMFCLQSIDYAEFEKIINGTTTVGIADKAINDKNGDDIVDTYAKKDDLTNFQNKDGDSKDNIVTFESSDSTTADAWTDVAVLATGEKHSSLFAKISTMFKNIRYIYTHFIKSENILETLEEIVANTQSGKVAGALAVKELNSNLSDIGKSCCFQQSNTTNVTNGYCPVDIQVYNDDTNLYKADSSGVLITKPGTYIVHAQFHVLFAGGDKIEARIVNSISDLINTTYADTNAGDSKQFIISLPKIVRIKSGQERVLLQLLSNNRNSYIYDKNSTNSNRIAITKIA